MESKNISESSFKCNNFRDEALKSYSSQKFNKKEINPKKTSQFKTINNSKEILIFSKKKNLNELNQIKPKLVKIGLPSVFNIIEKRHSSYDKKKTNSEQTFSNSNIHVNVQRKNESPIIKINEYSSSTGQKGFKSYRPKFNNYFREKALSPSPKLINSPNNDYSKNSEIIMISEINGEDTDSKNKTSFSDLEAKASIRNKTIATNYSSVGFTTYNENNNYFNDNANKFNPWNLNNNLNNANRNQIANLYQNEFFINKDNNKKYDNIYIKNKTKNNNKTNKNQFINKININILERTKRSPSETHEEKKYSKNIKEEILKYNKSKRINTHQNEKEQTDNNNKYYSHDNKNIRKNDDNKYINQINLNEGITFKNLNGYKYYFNLPNVDIYLLKDIQYSLVQQYKQQIKLWKNKYNQEQIYIKILDIKKYISENKYIIIMEHPVGGENLTNFINSIGFSDQKILFEIISKIYNNILYFQNDNFYYNTFFCLCDIFLDVSGQVKIIPPIIRKLSYLENNKKCACKNHLDKIKCIYNINCISNFCLGFAIIQLITQNLIFKMKSFDIIINNKNNKDLKRCCLVHTLLTNEILFCDKKEDLLFSNFLELYPKTLIQFLHECTEFNGKNINQSFERLIQKRETNNYGEQNTKVQVKELLRLIELPKNKYCNFNEFLYNLEILYKNLDINSDMFNYSLKKKKIISSLSRAFKIKKEELLKYFLKIIRNNDEKYY